MRMALTPQGERQTLRSRIRSMTTLFSHGTYSTSIYIYSTTISSVKLCNLLDIYHHEPRKTAYFPVTYLTNNILLSLSVKTQTKFVKQLQIMMIKEGI